MALASPGHGDIWALPWTAFAPKACAPSPGFCGPWGYASQQNTGLPGLHPSKNFQMIPSCFPSLLISTRAQCPHSSFPQPPTQVKH